MEKEKEQQKEQEEQEQEQQEEEQQQEQQKEQQEEELQKPVKLPASVHNVHPSMIQHKDSPYRRSMSETQSISVVECPTL